MDSPDRRRDNRPHPPKTPWPGTLVCLLIQEICPRIGNQYAGYQSTCWGMLPVILDEMRSNNSIFGYHLLTSIKEGFNVIGFIPYLLWVSIIHSWRLENCWAGTLYSGVLCRSSTVSILGSHANNVTLFPKNHYWCLFG